MNPNEMFLDITVSLKKKIIKKRYRSPHPPPSYKDTGTPSAMKKWPYKKCGLS
jgi:hypothetical protein